MNIGAELGQYFVQTHSKKSEDSMEYATGKKSLNKNWLQTEQNSPKSK